VHASILVIRHRHWQIGLRQSAMAQRNPETTMEPRGCVVDAALAMPPPA